ncbi:MAG: hypothetical protein KID02_07180 [Clostridiales bacterium]|nr:hypothetical protein [Clostridiales bacterium]
MRKSTKEVLKTKVAEQEMVEGTQEPQETGSKEQILAEVREIQHQETCPKEAETQQDTHEDLKTEEKPTKTIDWSDLKATKSKAVEKVSGEEGICTIVNCKKNGNKRIAIASKLLDAIGNPKKVEVGIMPNGIAISEKLPIEANEFSVKKLGAKKAIYAGALVEEITEEFKLDYNNRTSITFQKVEYDNVDGYKVALITIQ